MKRLIFVLSAFMLAILAFAQDKTEGTLSLSLEDAKKYALEHNRNLQNASLAVKQKYAARWQSIATMLPQASASLDYMNMCGYEMELMGMGVPMNPYGTFGVKASMAVSGTMIVAAVISNLAVKMADISAKKSEQTVINDVVTTYYSIVLAQHCGKTLRRDAGTIVVGVVSVND